MKQLLGYYDTQTGLLYDKSDDSFEYENEQYILRIFGHVYTDCNIDNSGEDICNALLRYGNSVTEHIGGVYVLLSYEKESKVLSVFHDRTTSPVALYYTVFEDKCYYGTSLKSLLMESKVERTLNEDVLEDFLLNGYLYGCETLIKQVNKIESHKFLRVSVGEKAEQIDTKYSLEIMSAGEALDSWQTVLDEAISKCYAGKPVINAPLSSGYDSSYIVDTASKESDLPINAFSVGGKFGKNELPRVEENAKEYDRVKLYSALTDDSTLENLADIVWRLEGAVYENGLFLQYELARLVQKSGKDYLICGECADQVMNDVYLDDDRIHPNKPDGKPFYYEFDQYPYIFGSYLILKKNGIMANSFGIETRYPYLDDKFVSVSHALRDINGKDKRCHVACCRRQLPQKVIANISKIGGATECHSLFNSQDEINEFFSKIENSDFYKSHKEMLMRTRHFAHAPESGVSGLKNKVRNAVLNVLRIGVENRKKNAYFVNEMKLRDYLCYAYVILFDKLIISGEYDEYFGNVGINASLKDLL